VTADTERLAYLERVERAARALVAVRVAQTAAGRAGSPRGASPPFVAPRARVLELERALIEAVRR
jgi:hypothetical protein